MAYSLPKDPPADVDLNDPTVKLLLYLHGVNQREISEIRYYLKVVSWAGSIGAGVLIIFLAALISHALGL